MYSSWWQDSSNTILVSGLTSSIWSRAGMPILPRIMVSMPTFFRIWYKRDVTVLFPFVPVIPMIWSRKHWKNTSVCDRIWHLYSSMGFPARFPDF